MHAGGRAWRSALRWGAALVWLGVILLAHYGPVAPVRLLAPVTDFVAALVQSLLPSLGIGALRAGPYLYVPGAFAYEVALGCTGVAPAAVLAVAIAASPAPAGAKWWGVGLGAVAVFAANLVRLLHLFYLGVHAPALFAPAHAVLWEAAIVLLTVATWAVWSRWAEGPSFGQGRRLARPASS
jgi:exosortase/archaeosortase family protein